MLVIKPLAKYNFKGGRLADTHLPPIPSVAATGSAGTIVPTHP